MNKLEQAEEYCKEFEQTISDFLGVHVDIDLHIYEHVNPPEEMERIYDMAYKAGWKFDHLEGPLCRFVPSNDCYRTVIFVHFG